MCASASEHYSSVCKRTKIDSSQPNAEDQARGLKPGLGATTMAINGAIGVLAILQNWQFFSGRNVLFWQSWLILAVQNADRAQATAGLV